MSAQLWEGWIDRGVVAEVKTALSKMVVALGVTSATGAAVLWISASGLAAQDTRVVTGVPTCTTCVIREVDRVPLGSRDDTNVAVAGIARAAQDGCGTVYLQFDMAPASFVPAYDGTSGVFLRTIGRRGEGPGEMIRAWRIAASSDELFVQDQRGLINVFTPAGRFSRLLRDVSIPLLDLEVLGDTLLAGVGSTPRAGVEGGSLVHLYDAETGEFVRGTGPAPPPTTSHRGDVVSVTSADEGGVWMIERPNRISRWSAAEGRRLDALEFASDWLGHVDGRLQAIRADEGYVLHDLWLDPVHALLWVVSVVDDPATSASGTSSTAPGPVGQARFGPAHLNRVKTTIISVVDPGQASVLAHYEMDEAAMQVIRDGRVVVMQADSDGFEWVELVRLRLSGLPSQ